MSLRTVALGDTFDVKFTTRQFSDGVPTTASSLSVAAYPGNSTTEITAGITVTYTSGFDSRAGLVNVRVVCTSGNGYAANTDYALVVTAGTVGGTSIVGEVVGEFTTKPNDVNVASAADTAWGSGAITAASIASNAIAAAKIATGAITNAKFASGAIDAAAIAADAIGASELAADAATEIGTAVWAATTRILTANTNLNDPTAAAIRAEIDSNSTQLAAIVADTNELQTDDVPGLIATLNNIAAGDVWDVDATGHQTGGTFGQAIGDPGANTETMYDAVITDATGVNVATDVADILVDTAEIGVAGAGLTNINLPDQTMNITGNITGDLSGSVGSVTGNVGGTINGLTATALANFFDTDSGSSYAAAVAGSVGKEIADNAGGSSLTEAGIADAVWEELIGDHSGTSGSTAEALAGASAPSAVTVAAAVWDLDATGHQTAGTFGEALGDPLASGNSVRDLIGGLNDVAATDIVSGGAITTSGGAVSNVTLVGTTTTNTDMRGTDNAALASVLGALADAAAAGDPTATDTVVAYVKQLVNVLVGTTGITTFPAEAAPANNVSLAEVIRAIHADVTGLNGDAMRGTDSAALAANYTSARAGYLDNLNIGENVAGTSEISGLNDITAADVWDLDATGHQTAGTFGEALGDPAASGNSVRDLIGGVQSDTDNIQSRLPAALVSGRMDADVGAIQTGAIDTAAFASGAIDAAALSTDAGQEIADALLDRADAVETGLTPRQLYQLVGAALAGQLSGAATTTITIKAAANPGTTRITATVDSDGNRSGLTLNV